MQSDCSQDITRFNREIRPIEYRQNTQKVINEQRVKYVAHSNSYLMRRRK